MKKETGLEVDAKRPVWKLPLHNITLCLHVSCIFSFGAARGNIGEGNGEGGGAKGELSLNVYITF